MELIGFCYCTGVRYCDKSKPQGSDYKHIAYVWENGDIAWDIDPNQYSREELLPIYQCSAAHINKVNEMKQTLKRCEEELPTLEPSTFKHYNTEHYINRLKFELEDLEKYKTTSVIHY